MKTLVAMDTKLLFMLRDFLMALPFGERFWTSISWLGDGGAAPGLPAGGGTGYGEQPGNRFAGNRFIRRRIS